MVIEYIPRSKQHGDVYPTIKQNRGKEEIGSKKARVWARTIGVGPAVGHGEQTLLWFCFVLVMYRVRNTTQLPTPPTSKKYTHGPRVPQVEALVREFITVDALEARAIPLDEVACGDMGGGYMGVCD